MNIKLVMLYRFIKLAVKGYIKNLFTFVCDQSKYLALFSVTQWRVLLNTDSGMRFLMKYAWFSFVKVRYV